MDENVQGNWTPDDGSFYYEKLNVAHIILSTFIATCVAVTTFAILAWVSATLFPSYVPLVFHSVNTAERAVANKVVNSFNN